ncbi:sensor domain-containing diguanylate cyclase [Shewanella glacialipiscicola]|uniref:sensor domain-containing diguanylate cyclase n=1 Tax=Shewanella glacialipiscicola TaxID=614069 RepID=UPI003D795E79
MLKNFFSLILLLGLWICSSPTSAILLSIDESTTTPLNLTPWLMVAHPVSANNLADIQALPKNDWHSFTNADIQKLSGHDFWLNFSLTSPDKIISHILALDNPLLDKITIYHLVDNSLINTTIMGDIFPYSERPFLSNIFLYPFKINKNDTHTFYLHIQTEGNAAVPLNLWSSNDLAQIAEATAVEHGFQLGILAAIGIFSLFIAFASGSFSYSYYSGYVLSMTLLVATINGFAFRYLWPDWPVLQQIMVPFLLPLVMAFALMFTEKILQLKYLNRRMLLICRYSAVYILCVGLASPFMHYGNALYIEIISVAVISLVLMVFAITQAINGHKLARMYTIGWMSMLTGACISSLLYLSVIELNVKPQTPVMLGLTFEIIFMSLVLAIRYNDERKSKIRIQQEALKQAQKIRSAREEALKAEAESNQKLEQMVQERTLELEITLRELHEVNHKLTEQSTIDSLTGVKNRSAFDKRLIAESRISRRQETPIALLMLDIDRFKSINDQYGHLAGDQALRVIAQTLQQHLKRPTDLVSRFGGEEFAIILPNTVAEGAIQVAETIREAVAAIKFEWEGKVIPLSISIGVSADIVTHEQHGTELLEQADKALYQAKNGGRNQVRLYSPAATPASN